MTLSLAIKTKDRGQQKNFLAETIENLSRAGVFESSALAGPVHIVDGGSESFDHVYDAIRGVRGHFDIEGAKRTMHQNAQRCIEVVGAERGIWAMVIEDDIDVIDKFVESTLLWLDDQEAHARQMYVLGANYAQIDSAVSKGKTKWDYPVTAFYAAQALVWKRETAEELAKWLGPDPHRNGVRDHGHDLLLQEWGKSLGLKYFVASAPSFVQHIGGDSSLGNRFFQFASWPGREWSYKGVTSGRP